jgi:hypothetical protein
VVRTKSCPVAGLNEQLLDLSFRQPAARAVEKQGRAVEVERESADVTNADAVFAHVLPEAALAVAAPGLGRLDQRSKVAANAFRDRNRPDREFGVEHPTAARDDHEVGDLAASRANVANVHTRLLTSVDSCSQREEHDDNVSPSMAGGFEEARLLSLGKQVTAPGCPNRDSPDGKRVA